MALFAAETCSEKSLYQFPSVGEPDDLAAETNHVQIIVLDALVRRKVFVDQTGADTRDFVGCHTCSDSASTNSYTTIHFPGSDGPRQRNDKIRIVIIRL